MSIYDKNCLFVIHERGSEDVDKCSFCGEKMQHGYGGLWSADVGGLKCCIYCAETKLPTFLADSLYAKNLGEAQKKVHGPVMATLQRALASRAEFKQWNGIALSRRFDARATNRKIAFGENEKESQTDVGMITAFGVKLVSRYNKVLEMAEMLNFVHKVMALGLLGCITDVFYDSKADLCIPGLSPMLQEFSEEDIALRNAARATISVFDWRGTIDGGE